MKEAILYKKLDNSRIECDACAFRCKIDKEMTGICGIRKNIDGKLQLLVYGKAIAINVDPIEKKPLYHFLPGSSVFSIGTIGCNFRCGFCQNWDISQMSKDGAIIADSCAVNERSAHLKKNFPVEDIGDDWSPDRIVNYCLRNKIPSIAYTYNEPTIFFEYSYDTAKLAHKKGIKNIYVSNGYATPELVEKISPYLDAINIDLKSFSNEFYLEHCGAKLQPVLDGIKMYHTAGVWIEITTLVIPGQNDDERSFRQITDYIASISKNIPWHISRFHPDYKMKKCDITPEETLSKAHKIGKKAGLKYIYIGNMEKNPYENTGCPECGKEIIIRDQNEITLRGLQKNRCKHCGIEINGVWI